jgi:LysM repeat protein/catechol 2,3-dioxygenase-like lactoylglutathione lyase family enzyme
MPRNRFSLLAVVLMIVCALLMINLVVVAQDNLLTDPGFESTSVTVVAQSPTEGITFAVSADWNGWYTETPRNAEWQNRIPNGTGRNNAGFGFVRSGNRSMELSRGFSTFTAAIYQTVTVPENANLRGSAYMVMDISGDNAGSANSAARVGIDPTGGTNPLSNSVIWSPTTTNALASNGFRQVSVNATAQGTQVTLFLYATQSVPTAGNGIFWDDASLTVGGPGGGSPANPTADGPTNTPVPTAPSVVAFVVPQQEQNDGSIVHVVQEGDVLASIAVAYGVSIDEIRALNPEIGQGRFLRIGQELTIRRSQGAQQQQGNQQQGNQQQGNQQQGSQQQGSQQQGNQQQGSQQQGSQQQGGLPAQQGDNQQGGQQQGGQQQGQGNQQQGNQQQGDGVALQPQQPQLDVELSTIYYWVNDIAETRSFYTDLIGLEETSFFEEDGSGLVVYDAGNVEIIFLQSADEIPVIEDWARQPNYDGGVIEEPSFVIRVTSEEFDAIIGRIAGSGASVYNDSVLVPQVGQQALFMRDPMGNTVQILTESS